MEHKLTGVTEGKMGIGCSCGKRFPVEAAAKKHVIEENKKLEDAKLAAAAPAADETPAQYRTAEQDIKDAGGPVKPDTQTEAAAEPTPAEPKKPEAKAAPLASYEIVSRPAPASGIITSITSMEIADQMVLKYATTLINSEIAPEFQTRMKLIQRLNPKLAECTPQSLFTAMMACVNLQLMPNTTEGLAYIIPYGREAQFQMGYRGMAELAYRTGNVKKIDQEAVFEGDEFEYSLGLDRKLIHKPNMSIDRTDYKKLIATYSTVKLLDGDILFEVVSRAEIDKIRNKSKANGSDSPWAVWPVEQAKKTATKRLAKLLPSSKVDNRIKMAAELDSLQEAGKRLVINAETGEIFGGDGDELATDIQDRVNSAESRQELNTVLQSLSVADRKKAAPLVQIRMRELA